MQTSSEVLAKREGFREPAAPLGEQIKAGPIGSLSRSRSIARSRTALVQLIGFSVFSLVISFGFFWQERNSGYSSLSGDQLNILAICAKKDYPNRFQY